MCKYGLDSENLRRKYNSAHMQYPAYWFTNLFPTADTQRECGHSSKKDGSWWREYWSVWQARGRSTPTHPLWAGSCFPEGRPRDTFSATDEEGGGAHPGQLAHESLMSLNTLPRSLVPRPFCKSLGTRPS